VDIPRQVLWANSGSGDQMKNIKKEKFGLSGAFKYDLTNKKLIKKYILPGDVTHLLNDLVIHSAGDVFLSDTETGALYTVSHKRDELELFIKPGRFLYPNGITISDDQAYVFVAHLEGISRIDINSKKVLDLSYPPIFAEL